MPIESKGYGNGASTILMKQPCRVLCLITAVLFNDMTALWAKWTAARSKEYLANEAHAVSLHGRSTFESRSQFYLAIDELFAGGRVGGMRLTGRRPSVAEAALLAGRKRLANKKPKKQAVRMLESEAAFFQQS